MKSLKLNQIEKETLSARELQQIKGGYDWICSCSCFYEGTEGGSSTRDNGHANARISGGRHSVNGDNAHKYAVTLK